MYIVFKFFKLNFQIIEICIAMSIIHTQIIVTNSKTFTSLLKKHCGIRSASLILRSIN